MIAAAAAWALRGFLWRMGWNVARLLGAVVFVLLWSGCTAQGTITTVEGQPGGRMRLLSPTTPHLGGGGFPPPIIIGPVQGSTILPPPLVGQWAWMVFASANAPCAFPGPEWLAALAFYESAYGANPGPSSAGAYGYAQFMPDTFIQYGVTRAQANDYTVMLPAMVRKLCHDGIATNLDGALLAYNNSRAYVEHIKALRASWGGAGLPRWQDVPTINQFDVRNWANRDNFTTWAAAACSPAALDWLLSAYGTPPGSIDAALALIGPNTSISSRVGLLDHTGTALASAISKAGYTPWRGNLSQAQLIAQLREGPMLMDGARWFGVGHWFVATGSDAGGINIHESSSNDIRYLTWSRLYGEVGWDGWAVGIKSQPAQGNQA